MTEQDLIKFKNLSMQDGRLNLQWFADYVAQAEREACLEITREVLIDDPNDATAAAIQIAIRARGQE